MVERTWHIVLKLKPCGQVPQGLEGFKSFNGEFLAAFPDLHGDFDFLLAEGDMVAGFSRWNGTHKGAFLGYPATDNPVSYRVADLWRISNCKIVEHWDIVDSIDLMTQIGAINSSMPKVE
jgi:predicted ester cyclase